MKIILNKTMIEEILQKYYKEQLDIDGKVRISVFTELTELGCNAQTEAAIKIELTGHMRLFGKRNTTKIKISIDEMLEAIKYYIEQEGYTYVDYEMDKGLESKFVGCGMGEYEQKIPYFNGININVDVKNKKKEKIRNESK